MTGQNVYLVIFLVVGTILSNLSSQRIKLLLHFTCFQGKKFLDIYYVRNTQKHNEHDPGAEKWPFRLQNQFVVPISHTSRQWKDVTQYNTSQWKWLLDTKLVSGKWLLDTKLVSEKWLLDPILVSEKWLLGSILVKCWLLLRHQQRQ